MPHTFDDKITESGIGISTRMMSLLGITNSMLQDNGILTKFQEIVEFFKQFEDGMLKARRIVAGKPKDERLDILMEFTQAYQRLQEVEKEIRDRRVFIEGKIEEKQNERAQLESIINAFLK